MKKSYLFILLFGFMLVVTSCLDDDDGYSLGDMWIGFGMIDQVSSDPVDYRIHMDNGNILVPVASGYHLPWYYYGTSDPQSRLKTGDRILLNFTILDDDSANGEDQENYFVRVNSVKKILLKGILDLTEENQDSIGHDPVNVKKVWQTDSLLNFEIKYWGRYEVHYINLVKEPGMLTSDDQPIELELRHNDNGDLEDLPYSAFVSFNLKALQVEGLDSVQYRVTSTDYDSELFEYEGVYHYGGESKD